MPDIYSLFVIILFTLAIIDLVVGVSNDAVNFLISAIGAKVAPRRIIMVIAGIGVFVGATFSSGMMEVARKGIFHPDQFVFSEIMIIFLAVMITDIILLDTFNTLGLPTSTTVSIVFELLGAAVAISMIKITAADEGITHLSNYINTDTAIAIISGILLSVVVAFSVGTLVQYFSRILFSFNYKKNLKWIGVIWGAVAMAALTHFLFVKGLKNASFIDPATLKWLKSGSVLIGSLEVSAILVIDFIGFVAWLLILKLVDQFTQVNILKIVVLAGTFALAMAFAGNDLVNFIGVPIAGLESFWAYSAQGVAPDQMSMEILMQPVQTKTFLLLIAGAVMVITLWLSRKARTVTETSVNLARQGEGQERFKANAFSRTIVQATQALSEKVTRAMPEGTRKRLARRFQPAPAETYPDGEVPAFDMIRASVNLTVAAMLISFATSLKLPLSTTYVTFMVAMGTSLADKAWGRESAVYRIAGVVSVIGGWFFTAFVAFTAAAIFASIMYAFGAPAVFILFALALFLIGRSFFKHKKKDKEQEEQRSFDSHKEELSAQRVKKDTIRKVQESLEIVSKVFESSISGLLSEDLPSLKQARKSVQELVKQNEKFRYNLFAYIKRVRKDDMAASQKYLKIYDFEQDLVSSAAFIANACTEHVANVHKPFDEKQSRLIQDLKLHVLAYFELLIEAFEREEFQKLDELRDSKGNILEKLDMLSLAQVEGIQDEIYGSRNSLLFFSLLMETKDMVAVGARFVKLYHEKVTEREPVL